MSTSTRGRPPEFDRELVVREAAKLFWKNGYSGTSTRELTAATGISTSSLYSAFGSKAGLFARAVEVYAGRYSDIYARAMQAGTIKEAVDELLRESIIEFTPDLSVHPGCLVTSAIMKDSADTLDANRFIEAEQEKNTRLLRRRFTQAIADGEILSGSSPSVLTHFVQTIWQGLSVQSNRGMSRNDLLRVADFATRALWSSYAH